MAKAIVVNAITGRTEELDLTEEQTNQAAARADEERARRDERGRERAAREQLRAQLRAVRRGSGPMTPAQLTEAVRQVLALLDVG